MRTVLIRAVNSTENENRYHLRVTDAWAAAALASLQAAGYRTGGARQAVVSLLARHECCLSAQEIFVRLRAGERPVGIASVYRVLEQLTALRLVQRVDVGDSVARYERAQPAGDHHHHAVCVDCGRVEPFADDRLEQAVERVAGTVGFEIDAHEVVLRGACGQCRVSTEPRALARFDRRARGQRERVDDEQRPARTAADLSEAGEAAGAPAVDPGDEANADAGAFPTGGPTAGDEAEWSTLERLRDDQERA